MSKKDTFVNEVENGIEEMEKRAKLSLEERLRLLESDSIFTMKCVDRILYLLEKQQLN